MKKTLLSLFSLLTILSATTIFGQQFSQPQTTQPPLSQPLQPGQQQNASPQDMANNIMQEMQQNDPQAAQAFQSAIQRGDLAGAKKIYKDYKKARNEKQARGKNLVSNQTATTSMLPVPEAPAPELPKPSLFERALSGEMIIDVTASLTQFGYDLFNKTVSTFNPPATMPVGPDYIIGPGDQFTMTLWGTTEGIYTLQVTKEGEVTLPKVGVVSVSGIRFGEMEKTLKRHLSRYYTNFNLSIAMGGLKTVTVYVVGEVTNPGSYSVPSLTTVYGALFAAGGPTKQGTLRKIQVLRSGKVIKTIDLYDFLLKGDRSQDIKLQTEDTVFVPLIGPVAGAYGMVLRPAIYELKGQETVEDVIKTAGGIMPLALGGRLQLTRYADNKKKVILDIKLDDPASRSPKSADTLGEKVRNMDLITIRPIYDTVWENVNLNGAVAHPGDYQWRPDLKLREIIQLGGLLPVSDLRRAEIVRLNKDFSDRVIIPIDLNGLLHGDEKQNVLLQPQDQIRVYTTYREAEKITISGEVPRSGTYEIMNGERLSDLLQRVGGFTEEAYVYGAVFKRKNVKDSQSKNLQSLISKLQVQALQAAAGSAATAVSAEEAGYAKAQLNMNQSLLNNLKTMQEQTEGRVAINITDKIDEWAGSKDDLLLQDGDDIVIPKRPQEVLVLGEVYSPGALIYQPGMTVKDYLELTGGYTKFAEDDEIFVVKANGFAFGADTPSVGNIKKAKLNAGDTIFVPQKMERMATLRTTKDIIDILFKTAVVMATLTVIF